MMGFQKRIPVTLIGGFLGAGKTTLVNHLIRSGAKKFGIIVNEFGETGIDGSLIENVDTDGIAELSNGCLCCVGREDLMAALFKMLSRPERPEYILIELSGLADPVPVAQTVLDPMARLKFELDGIVGVADARNLEQTLREGPEGAVQLAYASHVVLNKTDLASPEELAEAQRILGLINPLGQFQTAQRGVVEPQSLLDRKAFGLEWKPPYHQHQHGSVQSLTLRARRPLHRARLSAFIYDYLIADPANLLRAKGFLSVRGYDQHLLFQSVREIFSLDLTNNPSTDLSQLVVIGRQVDQAALEEAFLAAQS